MPKASAADLEGTHNGVIRCLEILHQLARTYYVLADTNEPADPLDDDQRAGIRETCEVGTRRLANELERQAEKTGEQIEAC